MKIALVGPYPTDLQKIPGGVAAVTYYLAQGLANLPGNELHIIAATKHVTNDEVIQLGPLTVHYLSYPQVRIMPNQMRDIGRIRTVLRDLEPDIVHSQTPSGADAASQLGLPCVLTIHGIPEQERRFAKGLSNRLGATLAPWLTRRALRRADAAIAISPYVTDSYRDCPNLTWYNISNPIEDRFFDSSDEALPGKLLYAGVMSERKNIPGLVRAFKRVSERNGDAQLFICGKIMDEQIFAETKRYIDQEGLNARVHLLGFVSQEELARHFAEAAVLCLFSNEETAPMIIAQAMCAGKPVVSTAAGGVPYLMRDGETGFVVPMEDEAAFAERVLALLGDTELQTRMGNCGRALANDLFRTESVAQQTIAVYREVLARRRR